MGLDLARLDVEFGTAEAEAGVKKIEAGAQRITRSFDYITAMARKMQHDLDVAFGLNKITNGYIRDVERMRRALGGYDAKITQTSRLASQQYHQIGNDATQAAKATATAFSRDLSGGAFAKLKAEAHSVFASIKSGGAGLLSGITGGGGGGGLGIAGGIGSKLLGGVASCGALGVSGAAVGGVGAAVTGTIAAVLTAKELFEAVVPAGIDFNETIESAGISLKRLLGSSLAARDEIEKLKKEALAAPFSFETLLELDQRLIGVGNHSQRPDGLQPGRRADCRHKRFR